MKQEIIELQNKAINSLIYIAKTGKENITLKAPTGSGKTYMMASFMNRMLLEDKNLVFLVSTPSKGKLASQNYDRFTELALKTFRELKTFYVSSGLENAKNTEYSLYIETNYNVFVLPTSQYTDSSRINKEKTLLQFLEDCKNAKRKIILIRDEAHIATNKLNKLSEYFAQTINFSATPKDDIFDICITEDEAVEASLIKSVEYIEDDKGLENSLSEALDKFKNEIKPTYLKNGIRPAFIIQISNANYADEEIEIIKGVLEEKGLQWVYFVEKENGYQTNSRLGKIKNKALWQTYVKQNDFPIDVIIFKMVITEGFDIPRACMLYQVRDSKSKQLDEQVIGRVRRNPALTNFEKLDSQTQNIFSKAYVYGIKPESQGRKRIKVNLKGEEHKELFKNQIIEEFTPFKITTLKEVPLNDIDITDCIKKDNMEFYTQSIFDAYRILQNTSDKIKEKQREFVTDYDKWFLFNANLESIKDKVASVVENYDKYGQVVEIEIRENIDSFFDNNGNIVRIKDWIWETDNDNEFSFDSEVEKEWFYILDKITNKCCKTIEIDDNRIYLFGKNFIHNSNIKFDYYHNRKHTSYPDFILKDKKDRIHIFEIKSVNKTSNIMIDEDEYKEKIRKLKEAYIFASKKTGYIFYIPIKVNDDWYIWRSENGIAYEEGLMNKDKFIEYIKI